MCQSTVILQYTYIATHTQLNIHNTITNTTHTQLNINNYVNIMNHGSGFIIGIARKIAKTLIERSLKSFLNHLNSFYLLRETFEGVL